MGEKTSKSIYGFDDARPSFQYYAFEWIRLAAVVVSWQRVLHEITLKIGLTPLAILLRQILIHF